MGIDERSRCEGNYLYHLRKKKNTKLLVQHKEKKSNIYNIFYFVYLRN